MADASDLHASSSPALELGSAETAAAVAGAYQVLARKYRPQTFAELIGQDALVRVLTNAVAQGRIAQAFILTGVRGVGKTTTARLIARALNCVGPDGSGGPTAQPCGVCLHCRAIAADRHVDVTEMDAASRTGVDDIRELIETVRYRPVSARFKVFIIDEVHMLSKNAFNALLKTLEEPPPDIKFVFATTEIQKVPVTVLSRCQRFSLPRVSVDLLAAHYGRVCSLESVAIEPAALALIARAADGSVRDGLSMLDQAIALRDRPEIEVTAAAVGEMLGIADRRLLRALFEALVAGDPPQALATMAQLYEGGAEPLRVLQDLLDLTHLATRLKLTPDAGADDPSVAGDREWALPLARRLSVPVLTRAWQMLLKGLGEVADAPSPLQAAEMVLIRLLYAADLPTPGDLARALAGMGEGTGEGQAAPMPAAGDGRGGGLQAHGPAAVPQGGAGAEAAAEAAPRPLPWPADRPRAGGADAGAPAPVSSLDAPSQAPVRTGVVQTGLETRLIAARGPQALATQRAPEFAAEPVPAPAAPILASAGPPAAPHVSLVPVTAVQPARAVPVPAPDGAPPVPHSFADVLALCEERREMMLRAQLYGLVHLVRFEPGRIALRLAERAPRDLPNRLSQALSTWTKALWVVTLSNEVGEETLKQRDERAAGVRLAAAAADPLVRAVLDSFPGAVIEAVRDLGLPAPAVPAGDVDNPAMDEFEGSEE